MKGKEQLGVEEKGKDERKKDEKKKQKKNRKIKEKLKMSNGRRKKEFLNKRKVRNG